MEVQMKDKDLILANDTYDKFEIILTKAHLVDDIYDVCDIYINEKSYIEMIAEDEMNNGFSESFCGSYVGLFPRYILLPEGKEFIDIKSNLTMDEDGRVHTLACALCGISECWTVRARITVTDETVTWSEIGHKEGRLGPFTFNKEQYLKALDYGNVAYHSAFCYANGVRVIQNMKIMKEMFMQAIYQKNPQAMIDLQSIETNFFKHREDIKKLLLNDLNDENSTSNILLNHDKLEKEIEKEIFLVLSKKVI